MKTRMKTILLLVTLFVSSTSLMAQDKYGQDSARCIENLSFYKEFVKQKNYTDALPGWRVVYDICPKATKSIYSDGAKIWQKLIKGEKDEARKQLYVDTLLNVYDQRIEHFGNDKRYPEGWILGRKGNDIYKYRKDSVADAYECLSKSIELRGENSEAGILTPFMWCSIMMFQSEKVSAEQVVNDYVAATDIADMSIQKVKESSISDEKKAEDITNLQSAKENLDNLFVKSEPATCERIVPIFTPKFEAAPDDIELLRKLVNLLNRQNCTEGDLFFNVSEKLNLLEPSSLASYALAKMSVKKDNYKEAAEFFKKAIEYEEVDTLKAQYYIELSAITGTRLGNRPGARTYALEAAKLKPNWGKPYYLIGSFYASSASSCGDNKFTKKVAYWAAVDKLSYAISIDPSIAEDANKLIVTCRGQFPNKEDAFFEGVTEGQSYTVGCWINETTKARF